MWKHMWKQFAFRWSNLAGWNDLAFFSVHDNSFFFFLIFFFFSYRRHTERNCVFCVFSLSHRSLFSLPHSFTLFFIFLDLFFFLFFFFSQNDKNRDVSNRNDFSRSINRMALSLGDSYNHFSYTQWQSTTSHINDWRKRLTHIYRNIHVSTDNTGYKKI